MRECNLQQKEKGKKRKHRKRKKGESLKNIRGHVFFPFQDSLGEIIQIFACIRYSDTSVSVLQSRRFSYSIYHFSLGLNMHFLFSDVTPSLDGVGL